MEETTRSHAGRLAIRNFRIAADALLLIGRFKMNGRSGQVLQDALKTLSPEIYGTMNDPRSIELKGLEYVMDRLPRGIEECNRFVMTSEEDFGDTPFEMLVPPKRRRTSYRISEREMCFVITCGFSEIYDILTHLTFLYIEAKNIHSKMRDQEGNLTTEWQELEKVVTKGSELDNESLNRSIWNLSIILGRTFHETRESYEYFESCKKQTNLCNSLFEIIYKLGKGIETINQTQADIELQFTPDLSHVILHHIYGKRWSAQLKGKLRELGLEDRPVHLISSNPTAWSICSTATVPLARARSRCFPGIFTTSQRSFVIAAPKSWSMPGVTGFMRFPTRAGRTSTARSSTPPGLTSMCCIPTCGSTSMP